jgi:hypothetical protein
MLEKFHPSKKGQKEPTGINEENYVFCYENEQSEILGSEFAAFKVKFCFLIYTLRTGR